MEATFLFRYQISTKQDHVFVAVKDQLMLTVTRGFFPHDYVPESLEGRIEWQDPKISAEDVKVKPVNRRAKKKR